MKQEPQKRVKQEPQKLDALIGWLKYLSMENTIYVFKVSPFSLEPLSLSNGNWTEWSTIQGVIGPVISNRPSA